MSANRPMAPELDSADQKILERALREILWGTSSRQPLEVKEVISQLEQRLESSEFLRSAWHPEKGYSMNKLALYGLAKLEEKRIATHNRLKRPDQSGGQTYYWLQR